MENNDVEEKIDLAKLFIVLMTLSAVGFGIGAVYLYQQEKAYAALIEDEDKALFELRGLAQRPENKPYFGYKSDKAGRTTSSELSGYLDDTAKIAGVNSSITKSSLQKHPGHKNYTKTTAKLKFQGIQLDQLVRYLHYVQKGKKDVFIDSIKLNKFDYEEVIPTCSADVDIVIYEEPEKRARK
jgi:hypothetical protein